MRRREERRAEKKRRKEAEKEDMDVDEEVGGNGKGTEGEIVMKQADIHNGIILVRISE